MHIDRGEDLVDHHSFFIFEGPVSHVHHSSFETHDFDIQVLGHDFLREKGYKNCWGVGRHIMGSQIFDYWYVPSVDPICYPSSIRLPLLTLLSFVVRYDTSNFILEHYVDGDMVNCKTETHISEATPDGLYIWGKSASMRFPWKGKRPHRSNADILLLPH